KLPKLSPDNPSAQALGYQHDAANVDLRNYPQRAKPEAANQYCHNCALFQGNPDDAWGLCALFPDKLISSNGWCSGYAPQQT
nr:high-potential iron-sulfur protein [Gammaproteobacteria bacterium]